jgi:checkpoint serine/threonine-protein kinase
VDSERISFRPSNTPISLLPLRARDKSVPPSSHYKNDPRYLKLWLNYIRFFSDSPRETFAFSLVTISGKALLFYEEFAAWLEGAGRWTQAEEVYELGLEREARPAERLLRKLASSNADLNSDRKTVMNRRHQLYRQCALRWLRR